MTALDARTLEAMRTLSKVVFGNKTLVEAQETVAAYMKQHDASTAAARDEALALKLRTLYLSFGPDAGRDAWREVARAARDYIAKEQSQ